MVESARVSGDQGAEVVEDIGLDRELVIAPAEDAQEANGHAGFVPGRGLDRLEHDLEDQLRLDRAGWPEGFPHVLADPGIRAGDLLTETPLTSSGLPKGIASSWALSPGRTRATASPSSAIR
jgi:hypothetical protein